MTTAAIAARQRVQVTDWPSIPGRLPLTEDSVRRTIAIADPAVRNLWITQSYADLAQRLLEVFETDQTWCTFATWASDTAGVSIRGRELPHVVDDILPGAEAHLDAVLGLVNDHTASLRRFGLARRLDRSHLEHLVARALVQVSGFIADGNTLVYGELAPLFVRLAERLAAGDRPGDDGVDRWLDAFGVPAEADQPLVRTAFRHYAIAASADPADRAQHVLTANIAAVLHEQRRLQDDIAAAMDAGIVDLGDDLANLLHRVLPSALRRRLDHEVREQVGPHLQRLWQHVATATLMTLSTPTGDLHLHRDVPPLRGIPLFPSALQAPGLPPLRSLLDEWDATGGTGVGSGADDWTDIHQRMTYIVNLFRSRQQHLALTVPPFTTAQLAWMVRGEVPPNL